MKRLILFCIVVLLSLSIGIANISAQCPTDLTCPWTPGPSPVTVAILNPSTGFYCPAKVYYCYRICGGSLQTYISSIEFLDAACAVGIDVEAIHVWETALAGIYTANPWSSGTSPIVAPPCTTGVNYIKTSYFANCWKIRTYEGKAYLEACSAVIGCVTSFSMCWDYSGATPKLIVRYDGIVTTSENECLEPAANSWVISTTSQDCAGLCPH